ncbi:ABC transporter ATP-binding protein [bacterium]|nr:ABC transporter ATP-binding protein [bacterium]
MNKKMSEINKKQTRLEIRNINKTFFKDGDSIKPLQNVSLTMNPGEIISVQGSSGSGKTTLLLVMGALLQPDSGKLLHDNINVFDLPSEEQARFRATEIGFIFQQYHLIPYLTVLDNILIPTLTYFSKGAYERAELLIHQLGLEKRKQHLPAELSAGEKQRTALARALLNKPAVLLADEITGNLDPKNVAIVLGVLKNYAQDGGAALMVTHDPAAAEQADRHLKLQHGELITIK